MALIKLNRKISYIKYKMKFIGIANASTVIMFAEILARCGKLVCMVDFTKDKRIYSCYMAYPEENQPILYHKHLICIPEQAAKNFDYSEYDIALCMYNFDRTEDDYIFATKKSYSYIFVGYEVADIYACLNVIQHIDEHFSLIIRDDVGENMRQQSICRAVSDIKVNLLDKIHILPFNINDRKCELDVQHYIILKYINLSIEYRNLLMFMAEQLNIDEMSIKSVFLHPENKRGF